MYMWGSLNIVRCIISLYGREKAKINQKKKACETKEIHNALK